MILLNPGPVNVSERVTAALARGDICHREPECADLLARIRTRLVEAFAPAGGFRAVLVTGSGTAAVELAVRSAVSEAGRLVVAANGVYGERIASMAEAAGIATAVVRGDWTEPIDVDAVEAAMTAPDVEAVAVVHNETTTGLVNPVAALGERARRHGRMLLVDAVSGLAGDPLELEAAGADLVAGTSGKCIQAFPGMGFVLLRESLVERLRSHPPRSVYLSLRTYLDVDMPFTPAVQVAYAFDEALGELLEEGVAQRIARHARAAGQLRRGFETLGLACLLPAELRSNTITALHMPERFTYAALHDALKERGFVVYEGQGRLATDIVRVCNMGHLEPRHFEGFLAALAEVLGR